MTVLSPPQRRALRARAHHLQPVVTVGQHGLTPGVLHEIDVNLRAHELIKIRVFNDDRVRREAMLERICSELDAAPVQHLGKLLIVWRPKPEEAVPKPTSSSPRSPHAPADSERHSDRRGAPRTVRSAKGDARVVREWGSSVAHRSKRRPSRGPLEPSQKTARATMAKSTPQVRRPRTPMARGPARPPRTGPRAAVVAGKPIEGNSRRRRRTG